MSDQPEVDLRRHLRALTRRWRLIAVIVLAVTGSTLLASSRQTPLYEGTAKLLLKPSSEALLSGAEGSGEGAATRRVNNEIEVFRTDELRAVVERQLGRHRRVSVSQVGDTDVLNVSGRSFSPERAATLARAYATAYVELRRVQEAEALRAAADRVRGRVLDLQAQIDALNAKVVSEEERLRPSQPGAPTLSQPVAALNAERDHLLTQQAPLKQRLDQLELAADATTGGVQVVSGEAVPVVKIQPRPVRNAAVAVGLGLMLGMGLAFLLGYLDDSITTRDDLVQALPALPVLTVIPTVAGRKEEHQPLSVALSDQNSPGGEAFSSLRTSLQFLKARRAPQIFQVTSAQAGDGKTSVAANLAVVLARSGLRVVAVDCDLRRSSLHLPFGLSCGVGFTSVFAGHTDLESALQPAPELPGLCVLAAGPAPPNAPEVLSARKTAEMLAALQSEFDVVILDSPPVLPVADPIAVSAWVDATILVARAGRTRRRDLSRTAELLTQAQAPLVGSVLNDVKAQSGYDYRYTYRSPPEASQLPGDSGEAGVEPQHIRRLGDKNSDTRVDPPARLPHTRL